MDIYSHVMPDMREQAALAVDAALAPKYIRYKPADTKSPDFSNLGFFVPKIVVARLGVEPRT